MTLAAAQVGLGLVVQDELASLQRRSHLAEQGQTRGVEVVVLCRVDLHAAAVRLGAVERHVGVLQQRVQGVRVLRGQRQPDARRRC